MLADQTEDIDIMEASIEAKAAYRKKIRVGSEDTLKTSKSNESKKSKTERAALK